jgi:hypothetical protein
MAEKCNCCVGTSCEPADSDTCGSIHGADCRDDPGGCFARSFLDQILDDIGDHLLAPLIAGGTYSRLQDFRDRILVNSPLGRRALAYNRRFADEALAILRKDPSLFLETGRVFFLAARFSRTLLRVADGYPEPEPMTISRKMLEAAGSVAARVSEHASEELRLAIRETIAEIEALAELSAPEVLRAIGIRPAPRRGR